jgi:putative membrane protein
MSDVITKIDNVNNHLANERTFLAWVRTSLSIIVFGFVVSKFGIALREFLMIQGHSIKNSNNSLNIGAGFMSIGIIIALIALIRYQVTMRRIERNQFAPANAIIIFIGLFTALFGIILVTYLIVTAHSL